MDDILTINKLAPCFRKDDCQLMFASLTGNFYFYFYVYGRLLLMLASLTGAFFIFYFF